MRRQPCCDKKSVKKGKWTTEEDKKLVDFIQTNGQCCWPALPKLAGLRRCSKSCRLRWLNYLRPDLKHGLLNDAEEQLVIDLHARLGNRTDNEIKNHWNSCIKKKLIKMGIDPITHEPLMTQATPQEMPNNANDQPHFVSGQQDMNTNLGHANSSDNSNSHESDSSEESRSPNSSHEPLVTQEIPNWTNDQPHFAFGQQDMNKTFGHVNSSDNSNFSHENYTREESRPLNPDDDDDPLMGYILSDMFLNDWLQNFPAIRVEDSGLGFSLWDDNLAWLLDCQDLGNEELMLGFSEDMDINTLEMENKH